MSLTATQDRPKMPPIRLIRIEVVEPAGGPASGEFDPTEGISIGKAAGNAIVLTDATVSRYHLEIEEAGGELLLRDLGSSNGTWIGNVRIVEASIRPGTEILVGNTRLRIEDGAQHSNEDDAGLEGLVAESPVMRRLFARARRAAATDVPVLLRGETGTGKEVIAQSIHRLSTRAKEPFETVDCASLPPTLIGSELFGHEKGSFTGAHRKHVGAFERARGGTIFLDEIGELPLALQPMLLGVLERRRFRSLGAAQPTEADVRIITATHRDLRREVNAGRFRADLYYRLAVARLSIPPLRERPEDIPLLVRHFTRQITGAETSTFSASTLTALSKHPWEGNVRELRNVVEAALALGTVELEGQMESTEAGDAARLEDALPYKEARARVLEEFEGRYLPELLERADGNVTHAARLSGMDRRYLLRLLKRHGLR